MSRGDAPRDPDGEDRLERALRALRDSPAQNFGDPRWKERVWLRVNAAREAKPRRTFWDRFWFWPYVAGAAIGVGTAVLLSRWLP